MCSSPAEPQGKVDLVHAEHMHLVLKQRRGVFVLHLLELLDTDSGAAAIRKMRARFAEPDSIFRTVKLAVLCKRVSIEIAQVSLLQPADVESERYAAIVHINQRQPHELYTQAFRSPDILASMHDFARWNPQILFDGNSSTPATPISALLIIWKLDRNALCVVFVSICLISVVGGLVFGIVVGRMDLGIAIGSLVASILSTIEVLLVWLQTC